MAVTGLAPEKFFSAMGEAMEVFGKPFDLIDLDDGSTFSGHLKTNGLLIDVKTIQ